MEEMLEFQERLTAMQNVMDGPTNSEHLPNEMPSAFSPNNLNLNWYVFMSLTSSTHHRPKLGYPPFKYIKGV